MKQQMRTNLFKRILLTVVPRVLCGCVWAAGEMERNFVTPPDSARYVRIAVTRLGPPACDEPDIYRLQFSRIRLLRP